MTSLVPRERLFQDLFDFRRDFDQIFNRIMLGRPFTQEPFLTGKSFDFLPAVESYIDKDGKKYICRISLPGIEVKDVEIHAQGNVLTIKGERKVTRTSKDVKLLDEEINYGMFERMLTLPEGLLVDKLTAEYHNGVLEITAPVAVAALPRKIEIKTVPIGKQMAA
jgi:HSP20 family molecular chaperone IbpA